MLLPCVLDIKIRQPLVTCSGVPHPRHLDCHARLPITSRDAGLFVCLTYKPVQATVHLNIHAACWASLLTAHQSHAILSGSLGSLLLQFRSTRKAVS